MTSPILHAKAPWTIDRRAYCLAIVDGNGQELAFYYDTKSLPDSGSVTHRGRTVEEIHANARLHASAPALAIELKALLRAVLWGATVDEWANRKIAACSALAAAGYMHVDPDEAPPGFHAVEGLDEESDCMRCDLCDHLTENCNNIGRSCRKDQRFDGVEVYYHKIMKGSHAEESNPGPSNQAT